MAFFTCAKRIEVRKSERLTRAKERTKEEVKRSENVYVPPVVSLLGGHGGRIVLASRTSLRVKRLLSLSCLGA